ncbi:MAG: hypothetical protein WC521_02915 [Bdellovibrionales bacterium]|jgi:pimeloyl-ACP methyl ester carboxylesterase
MKNRLISIILLFVVTGCATGQDEALALVQNAGWRWDVMPAGKFDLAVATPERHGKTLWVYIEGDGRAFLSPDQPSSDPTPSDPVALRLALVHPGSAPVAYLARPCQYVLPTQARNCISDYWTNARYAPEVVASLSKAVDILKRKTGSAHVVLVGYSGGGALAILVAAKRKDVVGLVTVVADLDLAYWTKRDELTPLTGSLDPAEFASAVATISQVHFTGALDKSVGTDVVRSFTNRLPPNAPFEIIEEPDFTHTCCWEKNWVELVNNSVYKTFSLKTTWH